MSHPVFPYLVYADVEGTVSIVGLPRPPAARPRQWVVALEPELVDAAARFGSATRPGLVTPSTVRRLAAPPGFRCRLRSADRRRWRQRLTDLRWELDQERPGSGVAAAALLVLLLTDAIRLDPACVRGVSERDDAVMTAVCDLIESGFGSSLPLTDVAGFVGMSESHVTRTVRRATGGTVGDLLRARRMAHARALLDGTESSVEAIAVAAGYKDVSHFRRHFRRMHGLNPGDWRRGRASHPNGTPR